MGRVYGRKPKPANKSPLVFVPRKPKLDLNKQIHPNLGDLVLDCPRCKGRLWGVFVRPVQSGGAKVINIVCATKGCGHVASPDDFGILGGEQTFHGSVKPFGGGS